METLEKEQFLEKQIRDLKQFFADRTLKIDFGMIKQPIKSLSITKDEETIQIPNVDYYVNDLFDEINTYKPFGLRAIKVHTLNLIRNKLNELEK